jgi:hypothetical protein
VIGSETDVAHLLSFIKSAKVVHAVLPAATCTDVIDSWITQNNQLMFPVLRSASDLSKRST